MKRPPMEPTSFVIPKADKRRLEELAVLRRCSISDLLREAAQKFLEPQSHNVKPKSRNR
jgi:hypothetical protein